MYERPARIQHGQTLTHASGGPACSQGDFLRRAREVRLYTSAMRLVATLLLGAAPLSGCRPATSSPIPVAVSPPPVVVSPIRAPMAVETELPSASNAVPHRVVRFWFEGNSVLSNDELHEVTRANEQFRPDAILERAATDVTAIVRRYADHGYPFAHVDWVRSAEHPPFVDVWIRIDEGAPYTLRSVRIVEDKTGRSITTAEAQKVVQLGDFLASDARSKVSDEVASERPRRRRKRCEAFDVRVDEARERPQSERAFEELALVVRVCEEHASQKARELADGRLYRRSEGKRDAQIRTAMFDDADPTTAGSRRGRPCDIDRASVPSSA